ncbi:MAG: replication initiator protein A [Rhodospirillales bacterium]|nr:replication initiator protein A [Rhodospirillales bacterium]
MMTEPPLPAILEHARPRAPVDLMNWPWFSLAKTPRVATIRYQGRRHSVVVAPAATGAAVATIWDADILFWATSQLIQAQDEKLRVTPTLIAPARRILRFLQRETGRSQYARLAAALERLTATEVTTTLGTADGSPATFRWIEAWRTTPDGIVITVPVWLLDAIIRRRVLAITPRYFELMGGIERWLWLFARAHAAQISTGWWVSLDQLRDRSGSAARHSDFVAALRGLSRSGVLLSYRIELGRHRGQEGVRFSLSPVATHSAAMVPGEKPGFHPQFREHACE